MTGISATDAALEGFRISREKPRAMLIWAAFSLVVSIASIAISLSLPAARSAVVDLERDERVDLPKLMEMLGIASPIILFGLIVLCVMTAAAYRIILRPADSRFSYLRLGQDELRLGALLLIYLMLAILMMAVLQIAILLVSVLASALGDAARMFVLQLSGIATVGIFIYVFVRMSLAPAITFDRRKLAITDSWEMTRGQFWTLLGAYVLASCCLVVVAVLILMVFFLVSTGVMLATGGTVADVSKIFRPDETSLNTYLNPFMIAYMLVGSVFTALSYAVLTAPGALVYRELTRTPGAATAPTPA